MWVLPNNYEIGLETLTVLTVLNNKLCRIRIIKFGSMPFGQPKSERPLLNSQLKIKFSYN